MLPWLGTPKRCGSAHSPDQSQSGKPRSRRGEAMSKMRDPHEAGGTVFPHCPQGHLCVCVCVGNGSLLGGKGNRWFTWSGEAWLKFKFSYLNHTKRERYGLFLCCHPKPSRAQVGKGQRRLRCGLSTLQQDHNVPWPSPLLPTKSLLGGQHLHPFLSQPVCLEMRNEERGDRETETEQVGQKWGDGSRGEGRGEGSRRVPEWGSLPSVLAQREGAAQAGPCTLPTMVS